MTSAIGKKAARMLFAKHVAQMEPQDPLYEEVTDQAGRKKRVRVSRHLATHHCRPHLTSSTAPGTGRPVESRPADPQENQKARAPHGQGVQSMRFPCRIHVLHRKSGIPPWLDISSDHRFAGPDPGCR